MIEDLDGGTVSGQVGLLSEQGTTPSAARASTCTRSVTATIVFVDQVGSTAQLAAVGNEEGLEIRTRLRALLLDAVENFDGELAGDGGDGVFAVFDTCRVGVNFFRERVSGERR